MKLFKITETQTFYDGDGVVIDQYLVADSEEEVCDYLFKGESEKYRKRALSEKGNEWDEPEECDHDDVIEHYSWEEVSADWAEIQTVLKLKIASKLFI